MNSWKSIWESYYNVAKTKKLLAESFRSSTIVDKIYLLFTFFGVVISGYIHFNGSPWALFLLAVSEVGFLLKLRKLKDDLILNEYGDPNLSQAPPDSDNNKDSRYLMFKKSLQSKSINSSHVKDCEYLIDLKVDMAMTEGLRLKGFNSLAVGIVIGFLGAVWRGLTFDSLIYMGLAILLIGLITIPIIIFFPTRIEQLKEIKYFMALYCREIQ